MGVLSVLNLAVDPVGSQVGGVRKINAGNVVRIERAGEPFILWLDSLLTFY